MAPGVQVPRSLLGVVPAMGVGAAVGWLAGGAVLAHLALPIGEVEGTVLQLFAVAGLLATGAVYVATVRALSS